MSGKIKQYINPQTGAVYPDRRVCPWYGCRLFYTLTRIASCKSLKRYQDGKGIEWFGKIGMVTIAFCIYINVTATSMNVKQSQELAELKAAMQVLQSLDTMQKIDVLAKMDVKTLSQIRVKV